MSRTPSVLINALTLSHGGGWTYISNLLRELAADPRGFRYTLLVPQGRLTEIEGAEVRSLQLPDIPRSPQLVLRVLYEQLVLPRASTRYDLLYCVADMAPIFPRIPTVVALRNLNIYDTRFYNTLRMRALRVLVPAGLRRVRRVVFPTQAAADLIRQSVRIPSERVAVVHHGIAPAAFDAARPVEHDAPFLFLPAAPERHKNLGVLIEALRYVNDPRLELWLAGSSFADPRHAGELRALAAQMGVEGRIRFVGAVPYARILDYYRASQALVFPSLIETFGHPLLEAMLAGTPIVASDIASFREIAAEAALYFPPADARKLADAIDAVRGDDVGRGRRIAIGRERAETFTWKRSADALARVFREALSAP